MTRFDVEPSVANHFAWLRTLLGLERTLMAAVRTAVSRIGFGFTVAQFFQRIRSNLPEEIRAVRPDIPRNLGLVLIGAGIISLAIFTWQYHRATIYLRSAPFDSLVGIGAKPMHTPSYFIALAVMLIGVAAFISVFARF